MYKFIKANIDILALTETKKKENGEIVLEKGHIFVFSGVEKEKKSSSRSDVYHTWEICKRIEKGGKTFRKNKEQQQEWRASYMRDLQKY